MVQNCMNMGSTSHFMMARIVTEQRHGGRKVAQRCGLRRLWRRTQPTFQVFSSVPRSSRLAVLRTCIEYTGIAAADWPGEKKP
jgi:hypothetical protein